MIDTGSIPDGGIIYVLTNEAMPNLVKIGKTSGDGVERRVAELSRATGVPLPFRVAVARRVHDAALVERGILIVLGAHRINPAREFFEIEAFRVVALVNTYQGTDLTPQVEAAAEREIERAEPGSLAAENNFRKRRPPLNFEEMGVPIGAQLHHIESGETAEVVGPRRVRFRGEVMSLSKAHRVATGIEYPTAPTPHWTYEGRNLREIYAETYPSVSDETDADA